jgi:hypothetical protein
MKTLLIKGIIAVFFVNIVGCDFSKNKQNQTSTKFFDLSDYFEKEIKNLEENKVSFDKEITREDISQTKHHVAVDWNTELALFIESDINKKAWEEYYEIDTLFTDAYDYVVNYTLLSQKDLIVKKVKLSFEAGECVEVKIYREEENPLFISKQELIYNRDIGFQIIGFQKIVGVFESNFFIDAIFRKNT